jgi:hypothetical protein
MEGEELNLDQKDVIKVLHQRIKDGIFDDTLDLLEPYRDDPKVLKKIVNGINYTRNTPLFALTKKGRDEVGDRLGYGELLERLIYYGADVYAKDKNGKTALYYACKNGHKDMVDTLLINHAIVDEETREVAENYPEIVELLQRENTDVLKMLEKYKKGGKKSKKRKSINNKKKSKKSRKKKRKTIRKRRK